MTETQLRFLRAIGERLPLQRVAELYLFPPMRQGMLESGIAVIAAVREPATEATVDARAEACDPTEDASRDVADVSLPGVAAPDPVALDALGTETRPEALTELPAESSSESAMPMATSMETSTDLAMPPAADSVAAPRRAAGAAGATPRERHTVYTARYRLALKGPERGKWELNVVEEADAPLLTVEMVVRGVQRRAGDGAEPERLEPPALRELLAAPAA